MSILVLLRVFAPDPLPPAARPIGRAALRLEREGVAVLFGGAGGAWRATPSGWVSADPGQTRVIYDRYPAWTWPAGAHEALRGLEDRPRFNPPQIAALCRDKVATQAHLAGLAMPEIEVDPARFEDRLREWGAAFHKPRYGALGRGVRRVTPGDPLFAQGPGATRAEEEPYFLQRAISPPTPFAGLCLRLLLQRDALGWWVGPVVARASATDPVANVDRGAEALDAAELLPARAIDGARALALDAAARLPGAIELGADVVIDTEGSPWLIELNHRPGGRLAELARRYPERFAGVEDAASERPLRWLAGP